MNYWHATVMPANSASLHIKRPSKSRCGGGQGVLPGARNEDCLQNRPTLWLLPRMKRTRVARKRHRGGRWMLLLATGPNYASATLEICQGRTTGAIFFRVVRRGGQD